MPCSATHRLLDFPKLDEKRFVLDYQKHFPKSWNRLFGFICLFCDEYSNELNYYHFCWRIWNPYERIKVLYGVFWCTVGDWENQWNWQKCRRIQIARFDYLLLCPFSRFSCRLFFHFHWPNCHKYVAQMVDVRISDSIKLHPKFISLFGMWHFRWVVVFCNHRFRSHSMIRFTERCGSSACDTIFN